MTCLASHDVDIFRQTDKKVFGIYRNLEGLLRSSAPKAGLIFEAIMELFHISNHDLAVEEKSLPITGYFDEQNHKKQCESFKTMVNGYLSAVQFGNLPDCNELLRFLSKWLNKRLANAPAYDHYGSKLEGVSKIEGGDYVRHSIVQSGVGAGSWKMAVNA